MPVFLRLLYRPSRGIGLTVHYAGVTALAATVAVGLAPGAPVDVALGVPVDLAPVRAAGFAQDLHRNS